MKLNPKCMACQLRKQEAKIRHFDDEDRKKQYMEEISWLLDIVCFEVVVLFLWSY